MLDEFEDDLEPDDLPDSGARGARDSAVRSRTARLISRLYRAAGAPLRSRMIACLVRPLTHLSLAGVASGAFASLLSGAGDANAGVPIGDLAAYSADQIFELARFVEQASPDALQQVAGLLADNPVAASAFSAAAVMLLVRTVRALRARRQDSAEEPAAQLRAGEGDADGRGPTRASCGHGSISALEELVRRAREKPEPDPDTLSPD